MIATHERRPWVLPTSAALIVLAILALWIGAQCLRRTEGSLTYAQDDAYIHMAMSKNLVMHGTWGVTPGAYSASSSSPLWTLLLAASFSVFGIRDSLPLVLNVLFAVASVGLLGLILHRVGAPSELIFAAQAAFILAVPLVMVIAVGMEHTLQALLTLLTVGLCARLIRTPSNGVRDTLMMGVAAGLMVATRYEGLFVIAGCSAALFMFRRPLQAVAAALAGAVPVIAVGVLNLSQGWFFLPASIVMKRAALQHSILSSGFWYGALETMIHVRPPIAIVAVALAALTLSAHQSWHRVHGRWWAIEPELLIVLVASLLHSMLADFAWLGRYEAYLIALGVMAVAVALQRTHAAGHLSLTRNPWSTRAVAAALAFCAIGVLGRAQGLNAAVPAAAQNIYEQQRQMARFIGTYYDASTVVLNDIGAVGYYTNAGIIDVFGLGSLDVARARIARRFDGSTVEGLAEPRHVAAALFHESWLKRAGVFPERWIRVATWTISDNVACGDKTVSLFAPDPGTARILADRAARFRSALPPGVEVATFSNHERQP